MRAVPGFASNLERSETIYPHRAFRLADTTLRRPADPFLPLPSRMKLLMDRFQATLLHMRVDLRRRNIRMSQQFLDDPQIGPVRQKMSGKRVP